MKHIGIVGSRQYPRLDQVSAFIRKVFYSKLDLVHVVTGDADGVDQRAIDAAVVWGLPFTSVPYPEGMGKRGGPHRNRIVVDAVDALYAFWDEESRGTCWTVKFAVEKGIPVAVWGREGQRIDPQVCVDHVARRRAS